MKQRFRLVEYEPTFIEKSEIPNDVGYALWQQFDAQRGILQVQFPSPKTNNQWLLVPNGWVGFIQPSPALQFELAPRFPIQHVFKLWAYAYEFEASPLLESLTRVETAASFPTILANWLAHAALRCRKQGIAKAYVEQTETLPFVRGRFLNTVPGHPVVRCRHHALTTNIPDNQILSYTLLQLTRSGLLDAQTQAVVRRATHLFSQVAEPLPVTSDACYGRSYTRLTRHYRPIHQLCGFFLEQIGPTHRAGSQPFPAFLINMPRLFERFVARWLKQFVPAPWQLAVQESVVIGPRDDLLFRIDMVLYDADGKAAAVLDTKYKRGAKVASTDVHQLVTYAKLKQCRRAILIYPSLDTQYQQIPVDDILLNSTAFNLDLPIEEAGRALLNDIFAAL